MSGSSYPHMAAAEFVEWWKDEKADAAAAAAAPMMTLKERMKALMQEQMERQSNQTRTDFRSDLQGVSLSDKKAAVDAAQKAKNTKKYGWDIQADLADREHTASAIMNLFNRVRRLLSLPPS